MRRVYLDSNVFRKLKQDVELKGTFLKRIISSKERVQYYFGQPHLLDLQQDKTNQKHLDLAFMSKIVDENFLALPNNEENVNLHLVSPEDAFKNIGDGYSIEKLFDISEIYNLVDQTDDPEVQKVFDKMEKALDLPMNLNLKSNVLKSDPDGLDMWNKLIPDIKDNYTMREWMKVMSSMISNLVNKDLYKDLRRNSIQRLNLVTKFNIDINDFSFDDDMRKTPIKKSFKELINQSLESRGEEIKQFDFNYFLTAYNLLNILGIDKEKNRKAKFVNTLNDAQHAFYGSHCEYLVSDDEGFILKSKVLYSMLGISTNPVSSDEFFSNLEYINGPKETDVKGFMKSIFYELKNSLIIDEILKVDEARKINVYKIEYPIFSYFNFVEESKLPNGATALIFYRDLENMSKFVSFNEIKSVIDKAISLFGEDDDGKKHFSFGEIQLYQKDEWEGRYWDFDVLDLNIHTKNESKFLMQIIIKNC